MLALTGRAQGVQLYTLIVAYLPISCKSCACSRRLTPDEADDDFASRHGIVSSGITRVAAADALESQPATLQEAVLLNGLVCVLGAGGFKTTGGGQDTGEGVLVELDGA